MATIGKGSKLARFRLRDGVEVLVRYDEDHGTSHLWSFSHATVPVHNVLWVEWDVEEEKADTLSARTPRRLR